MQLVTLKTFYHSFESVSTCLSLFVLVYTYYCGVVCTHTQVALRPPPTSPYFYLGDPKILTETSSLSASDGKKEKRKRGGCGSNPEKSLSMELLCIRSRYANAVVEAITPYDDRLRIEVA